jgi:hypothetical protein
MSGKCIDGHEKTDKKIISKVGYKPEHTTVREILSKPSEEVIDHNFILKGRIRAQHLLFIQFSDGSSPTVLQLCLTKVQLETAQSKYGPLYRSSTISATVKIAKSMGKNQIYDCHVIGDSLKVLGESTT